MNEVIIGNKLMVQGQGGVTVGVYSYQIHTTIHKINKQQSFTVEHRKLVTQMVKNSPASKRARLDPSVGKIPWRREWLPTPSILPTDRRAWQAIHGAAKSQT